jgi:signal transduction histidine kinase
MPYKTINEQSTKDRVNRTHIFLKRPFAKIARFSYKILLKSKAAKEEQQGREFILNVILISSLALSGIFTCLAFFGAMTESHYSGISMGTATIVFAFFLFLYLLSRNRLFVLSAYLLVMTFFFFTTYTVYRWGVELPQGLLTYAFIIVMAGILVSARFAFELTFVISSVVIILTYFQINNITHPKLYWKPEALMMNDAVEFAITFMIISVVSWLYNREIANSLKRAIKSEEELKKERDMLEIRVRERTEELERIQAERMNQSARFIEFGKISSGLFHDLINHMTFLFFNIEKANDANEQELVQLKEHLRQANETKDVLTDYIEAAKKQIQNQKSDSMFSMKKEILSIIKILGYKLKIENVEINLAGEFDIVTYGNPIKFNQVIINIILNALDAYESGEQKERKINIELKKIGSDAVAVVEDFAGGIPEDIKDKVFEPFFTTKGMDKGAGIGLTTVKNIVEGDFGGDIELDSAPGKGCKFTIKIPIRNE